MVAGVLEQRLLEPMLHNQKLLLSALCFAVRTGNTFLGSLLYVTFSSKHVICLAMFPVPIYLHGLTVFCSFKRLHPNDSGH